MIPPVSGELLTRRDLFSTYVKDSIVAKTHCNKAVYEAEIRNQQTKFTVSYYKKDNLKL